MFILLLIYVYAFKIFFCTGTDNNDSNGGNDSFRTGESA